MNLSTKPLVDEVGRVVIHLPDDATFYGERSYIPVALDRLEGCETPTLLRSAEQGIHYMAHYEVFSALCSDRAHRTVDRSLLVGGAAVKPEHYLGLWRDAIASSVSAESAASVHGIRVVAVLRAPLSAFAGTKSSWTTCPFGTFTAFHAKYGKRMEVSDGAFALELDLARPECARDAYYAASMICTALRHGPTGWRASIELRTTAGRRGQAPLFDSMEN